MEAASRLRMPEYRGRTSWAPGSAGDAPAGGASPSLQAAAASRAGGRPARAGRASFGGFAGAAVDSGSGTDTVLPRGDHIRVAVRVRPLPQSEEGIIEVAGTGAIAIRKDAATGGNEFLKSQQGRVEERNFDKVFGPRASQKEVFAWCCRPLVHTAIAEARSATVFVYGATGAGKTHTMFGGGDHKQRGLIFRAIPEVFAALSSSHAAAGDAVGGGAVSSNSDVDAEADAPPEATFQVKVSFLEIYNEVVRDLLQTDGGAGQCRVLEDERRGVVKVANLVEAPVQSPEEALWYLQAGMQARTVESTAANSQSSRAHAVFTLTVESVRPRPFGHGPFASRRSGEIRQLHSKISLIDLAGSERAALTQNVGSALKDGARINQSLLALANCIDALTAKGGIATPRKKPPYRDSKLTLMLKGSLTGDGLVAMIANVHPGRNHFEDSNNTLEYARRASSVRTAAAAAAAARRLSRTASSASPGSHSAQTAVIRHSASFGCGGVTSSAASVSTAVAADFAPGKIRGRGGQAAYADDAGEDCACGTSSSSSSSFPPRSLEELRKLRSGVQPAAKSAPSSARVAPGCRPGGDTTERATTASSPEECLSEISLNSPVGVSCDVAAGEERCLSGGGHAAAWQGEGEEDTAIGGRGGVHASAMPPPGGDVYEDDDDFEDDEDDEGAVHVADDSCEVGEDDEGAVHIADDSCDVGEEDDGAEGYMAASNTERAPRPGGAGDAVTAEGKASVEGGLGSEDEEDDEDAELLTSKPGQAPMDELSIANALIAKLTLQQAALDARMRAMVKERNALLEERNSLEEENAKLRQADLAKDEQMARLLAACNRRRGRGGA